MRVLSISFSFYYVIIDSNEEEIRTMTVILRVSALVCNVFLAFTDKYSSGFLKGADEILQFSFCKTLTCAALAVLLLPISGAYINTVGVFIAALAGLFHATSVVLIMLSLKRTDAVYVNLFMAAGIILPSLFGWILWDQALTFLKICALLLLIFFLAMTLSVRCSGRFHFPTVIAMFVSYGMLMVAQGAFPKYCINGSSTMFSVIMYGCSSLILGVLAAFRCKKKMDFAKKLGVLCLASAVANLAINLLLTQLSSMTAAFVTFPVVHGGKLVAVTLLCGVMWREKLKVMQVIFAFLSIVCIVLLSL